jgi:formiminoglutamase
MHHLQPISAQQVKDRVSVRKGETKLGETCFRLEAIDKLGMLQGRFVVLGIPEDIGIRANHGTPGAVRAWDAFLDRFLNMQHNRFLWGEEVILAGTVVCDDLMAAAANADLETLRALTSQLDERVAAVAREVIAAGKVLIAVGGGHNNSYGLLRGAAGALRVAGQLEGQGMGCVNLDPHADLRQREGRHSGNGFSYALYEGWLERYAVIGLHESYNNEHILQHFDRSPNLFYNTFDSYVRGERTFEALLSEGLGFVSDLPRGVELDMDSIAQVASSAMTPTGITPQQARRYVSLAARMEGTVYLHLAESAPGLNGSDAGQAGKLLAYLATDFIRSYGQESL